MLPRVLSTLLAASPLLWASVGSAFPSARLEYVRGPGAESCPDEAAVRQAVAVRLGYDPFDRVAPQLLRTRVSRSAERFSARLEVVDSAGRVQATRELDSGEDCAELVAAMALSMSIVIDPEYAARSDANPAAASFAGEPGSNSATDAPAPAPTPAAIAPPASPTAPAQPLPSAPDEPADDSLETARAKRYSARLGAAAHLSFGAEPATSVGASLTVGVRRDRWSLALEGRYDAPASRAIEPRGELTAQVISAGLVPCFHATPLLVCGVGALGSLRADVTGVSAGHSDSGLYAAAGARLGAEWPIADWVALQLLADALFTFRPRSVLLNEQSVWDVPSLSARIAAGFIAEF